MRLLKHFKTFALLTAVVALFSCQANSSLREAIASTAEAADEYNTLSWSDDSYDPSIDVASYDSAAARLSRKAAVRVQIDYGSALISGSGTYFKYKGGHMVVTAAHLFALGGGNVLHDKAVITTPNEQVMGRLVYIDKITDIAIFDVPKLPSRKAATFTRAKSYPIGGKVFYSGFPGANNLLTFTGTLSGDGYGTDIAMHSFAYGGSSGSGVFDENGQFVGVVVSIMVGRGFIGPQLVGSVVYVAPATLIDTGWLKDNLRKARKMRNAGF
tara:strand:- start:11352 stop:12161 length:810 start_codon:yes stop_codon:yes gene_type:complete